MQIFTALVASLALGKDFLVDVFYAAVCEMDQGTKHLPSGLVNSLKVGSEMTVWEMVWTGSSRQLTSFGRQDLTQRMVSVFSSLTLRETKNRVMDRRRY